MQQSLNSLYPSMGKEVSDKGTFLYHIPCEACGSKDNASVYLATDGSTNSWCFGCGTYQSSIQSNQKIFKEKNLNLLDGEIKPLLKRKISEKTCRLFSYQVGTHNNKTVQIANYYNKDGISAQHVRYPNKDFKWFGETKDLMLFGQNIWRDKGKILVVTEGEIDAMSVSTVQQNKYPVVSVPNGAQSSAKAIATNIEFVEGFDEVVFLMDNDEPGRKSAQECASIITPGKAKIGILPLKDASDMLVAGRGSEIIDAIFGAKLFRPDGIIAGTETYELLIEEDKSKSVPYPWNGLNNLTKGLRVGELVTLCGGSGIGKSQVAREISYDLLTKGEKVGVISLEESVQRSIRGLVGLAVNRPIHLPEVRNKIPKEELKTAFDKIAKNCFFYDHWGSTDDSNLMNKIKYLAQACECKWIVLDHVSIVVSALEGDERRILDQLMTKLRSLCESLQVGMIIISHLRRPEGKGHEEGASVSLSQLRGSHAIAQLSDQVYGLSRSVNEGSNVTSLHVLKNRFCGETGFATELYYNKDTGRMFEEDSTQLSNGTESY